MVKQVCTNHIQDATLNAFIRKNGEKGECDYCKDGIEKKVIDISELGEHIEQSLYQLYDDAANWLGYDSAEGGYQGSTYDADDLIRDHIEGDIDYDLLCDLTAEISDVAWCDYDPYGPRENEMLLKDWENFKNIIQHHQRFTAFQPILVNVGKYKIKASDILDELGKMVVRLRMIKTLPAGTIIYRCRQHEKDNITEPEQLCSPPTDLALYPNRMSPAGVSMFYGSMELGTTILETVDPAIKNKPYYTTAPFVLTEPLDIVDFSMLPKRPSIFNKTKFGKFHWVMFLEDFVKDLSKPIKKDDRREHVDYAPTQVVTEYIKYVLGNKRKRTIDGMTYPSSKDPRQNCTVLFYDHYECLEKLKCKKIKMKTVRI